MLMTILSAADDKCLRKPVGLHQNGYDHLDADDSYTSWGCGPVVEGLSHACKVPDATKTLSGYLYL